MMEGQETFEVLYESFSYYEFSLMTPNTASSCFKKLPSSKFLSTILILFLTEALTDTFPDIRVSVTR